MAAGFRVFTAVGEIKVFQGKTWQMKGKFIILKS